MACIGALDIDEGADGDTLLAVDLDADLQAWEVSDPQAGFRQWCVPAAILNRGRVRVVTEAEEDTLFLEGLRPDANAIDANGDANGVSTGTGR